MSVMAVVCVFPHGRVGAGVVVDSLRSPDQVAFPRTMACICRTKMVFRRFDGHALHPGMSCPRRANVYRQYVVYSYDNKKEISANVLLLCRFTPGVAVYFCLLLALEPAKQTFVRSRSAAMPYRLLLTALNRASGCFRAGRPVSRF